VRRVGKTTFEARSGPVAPSEGLAWLISTLWGPEAVVDAGGKAAAGERFAALPSPAAARLLVPLSPRDVATSALLRYRRLRSPGVNLGRWALAAAIRLGPAEGRFRRRRVVAIRVPDASETPVARVLRALFDRDDLRYAVGVPAVGPSRKPVLHVFDPTGEPVAYVKIGWNEAMRRWVRNEAAALRRLETTTRALVRAPRLLGVASVGDLEATAVEPLPGDVRRHRPTRPPPAIPYLRELAALGVPGRGDWAGYLTGLRARALAALPAHVTDAALERLDRVAAGVEAPLGFAHGDWVPWNMAWRRRELHLFDWEHARDEVPVGMDLLHYRFMVAFNVERRDVAAAVAVLDRSRQDLEGLGGDGAFAAVREAYLLEILLRHVEAVAQGAAPNRRFHQPMLDLVRGEARGGDGPK